MGAKVTNALSDFFDVISYKYDGTAKHMLFSKGILKKEEIIKNPEKLQGTRIEFTPDHSILRETPLDPGEVYMLVRDILSLLPIGSRIVYSSINKKGKTYTENMVNEDGIVMNIIDKSSSLLIQPIVISYDNGTMRLDCAFSFDQEDLGGEDITPYANMCPTSCTQYDTHVTGSLDGICGWFMKYMNTVYLTDKERQKIKINSADVKTGLKLMISAWHLEAEFTGQNKNQFSNLEYRQFAKDVIINGLDTWSKSRPQDLLKVCKFLKDIATVRIKADSEKVKVTAKYATSATTGLPAKYIRPTGKSNLELFIVEGDSAAGAARQGRVEQSQGIFPIRGKILNVWQATPQKIAANEEIMGISHILGAGFGKNFDISKVKFDKIIIMTDGKYLRPKMLFM